MSINTSPTAPDTVNGEPLELVEDLTYLGSLISTDNGALKDIKARLGKVRCAVVKLQNIWKCPTGDEVDKCYIHMHLFT